MKISNGQVVLESFDGVYQAKIKVKVKLHVCSGGGGKMHESM
jgi:hypothetical protein